MSADVRSRAAAVLELTASASEAEAVGAFLKALPAAGFVPSANAAAALNVLAGTKLPFDPDNADPELTLRGQVEGFGRRFWSLNPTERLAEWTRLNSSNAEGPTVARLRALQLGLDLSVTPLSDEIAEEVAVLARELFVLLPRERAIRRNEWLLANASRHAVLTDAAAEVQRQQPALAKLEPTLFSRLSPRFDAAEFAEAATATAWLEEPPPAPQNNSIIIMPETLVPEATPRRRSEKSSSGGGSGLSLGWAWFLAVIFIVRILAALGSSSTTRPHNADPTPPPNIKLPTFPSRQTQRAFFTNAEVTSYKKFDVTRSGTAPPGYWEWVRSGKPEPLQLLPQTGTVASP